MSTPLLHLLSVVHAMLSTRTNLFFFFNDTAPTEIYTLSLHDALPISPVTLSAGQPGTIRPAHGQQGRRGRVPQPPERSEEHTSELQSRVDLVCRLLLEKKKKNTANTAEIMLRRSCRSRHCTKQTNMQR